MKNESAKRAERYISDISTVFMSDIDYRSYIEGLAKIEKAKQAGGEEHGKISSN